MIKIKMKSGFSCGKLDFKCGETYLVNEWQLKDMDGMYDIVDARNRPVSEIKKVLVLKSNGLGNVINVGPMIKRLKQIKMELVIDLCVLSPWVGLFRGYVDRVWTDVEIKALPFTEKLQWDLIINALPCGFDVEDMGLPCENIISTNHGAVRRQHEADANIEMINDFFASPSTEIFSTFAKWEELRVTDKPYFVCCNGYSKSQDYWSIKGYKKWADVCSMIKKHTGLECVVCGIEGEGLDGDFTDATRKYDLLQTGGILKGARFVIGNDTGLMHYASALGVKTFTLFGATSWIKNRPYNNGIVLKAGLKCQPCQFTDMWRKCKHVECMDIDPMVLADEIIKKTADKTALSICFATSGRYDMLVQTLASLSACKDIDKCQLVIVDDCSDDKSKKLIEDAKENFPCRVIVVETPWRRGKDKYYLNLIDMVNGAFNIPFMMFMADDIIVARGLITKIFESSDKLNEVDAIHFFRDNREDTEKSGYANKGDAGEFFYTSWTDGFLSVYRTALVSQIGFEPVVDERGSGAWFKLNMYFKSHGMKMLRHKQTWGEHIGNRRSLMNEEWRKENPITGKEVRIYD